MLAAPSHLRLGFSGRVIPDRRAASAGKGFNPKLLATSSQVSRTKLHDRPFWGRAGGEEGPEGKNSRRVPRRSPLAKAFKDTSERPSKGTMGLLGLFLDHRPRHWGLPLLEPYLQPAHPSNSQIPAWASVDWSVQLQLLRCQGLKTRPKTKNVDAAIASLRKRGCKKAGRERLQKTSAQRNAAPRPRKPRRGSQSLKAGGQGGRR